MVAILACIVEQNYRMNFKKVFNRIKENYKENEYYYNVECELNILSELGLLDDIPFKYIKDYLPLEETSFVDFEYQYLNSGCGWEFSIKYRFTLDYNNDKDCKTFTNKIENINTSSAFALVFSQLSDYDNINSEDDY